SPILKFMPAEVVAQMLERLGAEDGDILFFGADRASIVNESLGALRIKVGTDRGFVREGWAPLWVVD
ncbi:MAG TPA: aspartate--tRNA ligase, partial [Halieaceae bacterium]|nr:aspartate--tRNA ligase [Halieaceae bacterium]